MTVKNENIRLQSETTDSYLQKSVIHFPSKSMIFDEKYAKLEKSLAIFSTVKNRSLRTSKKKGVLFKYLIIYFLIIYLFGVHNCELS